MKKKLLKITTIALLISASLCCLIFAIIISPQKFIENYTYLSSSSEIQYYTKEDINDTQITIRKDIMNVTQRNLPRPQVSLLSDTFTLPNTNMSVTFPSYPSYYDYNNISSQYAQTGYSNYYKYMLLRQGMILTQEASQKSADGTLTQQDLQKHPAIDAQFGPVASGSNAVTKEITIDPSYRSLHTTGLYLPAGELASVKIEGLNAGESISIVTRISNSLGYSSGMPNTYFADTDNLVKEGRFDEVQISSQWNKLNTRLPYMQATFTFTENKQYNIGNAFGGIMHINVSKTKSPVKMTISGCVETPHYILGVTTPKYFEEYLRNAPGVQSCLDTENGILIGNDTPFRQIDDIENLALLWHSFFAVNETFTGGPYNANNLVKFDVHVPAGAAVHLGGGVSACPISWYSDALNYERLLKSGSWGVLHEIGHGNGNAYGTIWGLGGSQEGEVRNNALTVLAYINFLDLGTSRSGEHGEFANAYRTLSTYMDRVMQKEDYNNQNYFEALSTYANLMHSFGTEKFYQLLKTYQHTKSYNSNKRADFIIRCANIYEYDFRWYFNTMYKCNVEDDNFTQEQLDYFASLKEYVPIASDYQSGIDGNMTSGDIVVSAYNNAIFDLKTKTISPKSFEIVSVSSATYGQLTGGENNIYTYTPPQKPTKRDNFSFVVRQFNGVEHIIDVSLILNHNSSLIETYDNTNTKDIDQAIEKIATNEPTISYDTTAGVSQYNAGILLKVSQFAFLSKQTKTYDFYLKCDDATRVMISNDNTNFETVLQINDYATNYNEDFKFKKELKENQVLYFKIYNVNFGGQGFAQIGYKKNGSIVNLPISQIFAPKLSIQQILELNKNDRIQRYFVSNKGLLSSTLDTNKMDWQVITAPNHQSGNTYDEQQWEDGVLIETITHSKTDYLIDDNTSTIYHSIWNHSGRTPLPHEYTIDTQVVQSFNFYKITTRKTANALICKYALYISNDNQDYTLLSEGDKLEYSNYVATIKFPQTQGRYFKLLVYTTSGLNTTYFSIIAEIDAGILAQSTNLIPITNSNIIKSEDFALNTQQDDLPTNIIVTKTKNSKIRFAFLGTQFSLYATKSNDMGRAEIYIDNKYVETIDLKSATTQIKKIVYNIENLPNSNHIIEIVTIDSKPFSLDFVGLAPDSKLISITNTVVKNHWYTIFILIAIFLIVLTLILSVVIKPNKQVKETQPNLTQPNQKFSNKKKYYSNNLKAEIKTTKKSKLRRKR